MIPTKSIGIQCNLLRPEVLMSSPCQSEDEVSDSDDEIDVDDDDTLYEPDEDGSNDEDIDDCLYE